MYIFEHPNTREESLDQYYFLLLRIELARNYSISLKLVVNLLGQLLIHEKLSSVKLVRIY